MPSGMHSRSLEAAGHQRGNLDIEDLNSHSMASLNLAKSSTPSSWSSPTLRSACHMDDSSENPQRTIVISRVKSKRWIRTNASADDISIPATSERSITRKRIGFCCQAGGSTSSRIASSTCAIVPKKRKPVWGPVLVLNVFRN